MVQRGRGWLALGAILAGVAVAVGAFGAHGLRGHLDPAALQSFETAARYQMYHGLALLAVGLLAGRHPSRAADWAGRLFLTGTVLFSGSLYGLTLAGAPWLGPITPLGGVAFLAGWTCLAAAGWRAKAPD